MPPFPRRFPPGSLFPCLIAVHLITAFQCSHPSASADSGVLSNLRFAPSAFDSFRRNAELKFTLKLPETLNIYIVRKDGGGRESRVKTLVENARETGGSHSVSWLGDNDMEFFAPAGMYFGVVEIDQQAYETTVQVFHF